MNTPGTYNLGYSYTDAAGNEGVIWGRTVNVIANSPRLKSATISPSVHNRIFANAPQEIGRIAISAGSDAMRLEQVLFYNSGTVNLGDISNS